ncbi:Filament-like plant protein 4 [Platanthera zijinensis]|uniref:Filament-like plant protein 4 n=1 Tax=Platanthera zijinensis TaxID=2320716 RepID=A0AAP0G2M8_9ASPA
MKVSEEKYQVDAQVEVLKNNIQSCEREISSMKYELHVVAKELEIRNEEKNMIMKSAEIGNKQHLEDVKKVAHLEAECQRLRGLVRKRLPGPAALAQMNNPPSLTSMSEDCIDEEMSYSDSCATALISEMSHNKMVKDVNDNKTDNLHNLELMDDFLEMERLACLSTEPNVDMNKLDDAELGKNDNLRLDNCAGDAKKQGSCDSESSPNSTPEHASKEQDVLEDIGHVIQEGNELSGVISEQSHYQQGVCEITDVGISSKKNETEFYDVSDHDLKNAISYIHEFLVKLCKQDTEVQFSKCTGIIELSKKIEEFFSYKDRVVCNNTSSHDFVLDLIHILLEGTNLVVTPKANNGGCNCPDFIDKETLLENKVTQHKLSKENISRASSLVTHSSSFLVFSLEDFETLKLEKEKVEVDFAGCRTMLDYTNSNLGEVEQEVTEIKSELAIC